MKELNVNSHSSCKWMEPFVRFIFYGTERHSKISLKLRTKLFFSYKKNYLQSEVSYFLKHLPGHSAFLGNIMIPVTFWKFISYNTSHF